MTPERVVVDSSGWIEVLTDGGQADHVLALLADERSLVVPGEHGEAQAIQAVAQLSHSLQLPLAHSIILATATGRSRSPYSRSNTSSDC